MNIKFAKIIVDYNKIVITDEVRNNYQFLDEKKCLWLTV